LILVKGTKNDSRMISISGQPLNLKTS